MTKGLIQRGDFDNYDGTLAATRTNSTGGTTSGLKVGNAVDVLQVYGSASTTNQTLTTINKAVTALGTQDISLLFAPGTWTIDDDITFASNFTIVFPAGCVFNISSGKTVTINGHFQREHATYSSGSGTFTIAGTDSFFGELLNIVSFGAEGDDTDGTGTDDYQAFQDALDTGRRIFVPYPGAGKRYRIGKALRFNTPGSVLILETPHTRVHCTGDGGGTGLNKFPNIGCVLMGIVTFSDLTGYTLDSVSLGDETVTATTATDMDNFAAGDVVLVTSTTTYTAAGNTRPTWCQVNVIESITGGTATLRHPMQESGAANIYDAGESGVTWSVSGGGDTGENVFGARDCKIIGGWWSSEDDEGPFEGGGGPMIDCVIDVDRVTCRTGVAWGNLKAHCVLKANYQESRRSGTELSFSSHDNEVFINTDAQRDQSASYTSPGGAVYLNEGASRNHVFINRLDCATFAHDNGIRISNGYKNLIEVNSAYLGAVTANLVIYQDVAHVGTRPDTHDNEIRCGNIVGGASARYINYTGNGQEARNKVTGGRFTGAVSAAGIELATDTGSAGEIANVSLENDGLDITSGTNFNIHDCFIPDGINNSADWTELANNDFWNITTTASRLFRQATSVYDPVTVDDTGAVEFTNTVPAGSMTKFGDTLEFSYAAFIPGGSSSNNKTFTVKWAGTTINSRVTTTTGGSEVIIRGRVIQLGNTATAVEVIFYQDDGVVHTEVQTVGSLDLSANSYDLEMDTSVTAASGDTINIRFFNVIPNSVAAPMWPTL